LISSDVVEQSAIQSRFLRVEGKTIVLVAVERDTVHDPETLYYYRQMDRFRLQVPLECTSSDVLKTFLYSSR
jgi:hypothetical protein